MSAPAPGMPPHVLGAVLCAALMHAGWNALLKARGEPMLSTVLVLGGAALASALLLPFAPAPLPSSWPFIAASSAVQFLYYRLLIATYRDGDVSHAYPLMRGSAPPLVALANGVLTGERLSGGQWLALALICAGILAMLGAARGGAGAGAAPAAARRRTTLLALLTACVIAAYTLIDGLGVRRSGAPAAYAMWLFLLSGAMVLGWSLRGRASGRGRALLAFARAHPLLPVLGGGATLGSYGIALWAMTLAPVAAVAALRETSILFATAIAALLLREPVGPARLAASALIATGAVAMRLA